MCGLIGVFYHTPKEDSNGIFRHIELDNLSHRGPDSKGFYTDSQIYLGHTRLAILDLTDAGHQPMKSNDGRYIIIFNGEIYNHIELRSELEILGQHFISRSDVEVLLNAYKVWGRECVRRLRGMFAFAIWDTVEKTLFLARDRCGEKPLFYYQDEEKMVFASELKALLPLLDKTPELDLSVVDLYLHYQFMPEPHTLLQGVKKLPAAHTLLLASDKWLVEPIRYWCVEDIAEISPLPTDIEGLLTGIRSQLEEAVCMTLRADVPIGVGLSGGIDSGAIAAFAQKHSSEPLHAFCVGYPGRPSYDEREQARALAESLGMIVHEIELPVSDFVTFFPELVCIMDEPIADPAAFGHFSVPKAASDLGIKVLLSGIGGDEIFWGYSWVTQTVIGNQFIQQHPYLKKPLSWLHLPGIKTFLDKISRYHRLPNIVRDSACMLLELSSIHRPTEQLFFYEATPDFRDAFKLKHSVYGASMEMLNISNAFTVTDIGHRDYSKIPSAIIRLLFDTWLVSNCLSLSDRVSMGVGVESRLPFIDFKLIEYIMALRNHTPDHKLGQKVLLRAALRGVLPDEVVKRPKAGFQPPVHDWLYGVVKSHGYILRNGKLVESGVIAENRVEYILETLSTQGWSGLFFAYKLVLLELWYKQVVA